MVWRKKRRSGDDLKGLDPDSWRKYLGTNLGTRLGIVLALILASILADRLRVKSWQGPRGYHMFQCHTRIRFKRRL